MLGKYKKKKEKAKASNSWLLKPLKKSQDICDTSVFNITDNLMAKGGQMCVGRDGLVHSKVKRY